MLTQCQSITLERWAWVYSMQDTVLAQSLYHLNTAPTYVVVSHVGTTLVHHFQILARRRTNDCAGNNVSSVNMLPVFDPFPQRSLNRFCLTVETWRWLNAMSTLLICLRNKALVQHRVDAYRLVFLLYILTFFPTDISESLSCQTDAVSKPKWNVMTTTHGFDKN